MNIWTEMQKYENDFTPKEAEIYELVKQDPYSFTSSTASEIAERYHVSQSAISRFCQRLGYNGYADFRLSLNANSVILPENIMDPNARKSYSAYLSDSILRVEASVTPKTFNQVAKHIIQAENIYTSGYGSSSIAADWTALALRLCKFSSYNIPASREMEFLRTISSRDIIILYSVANPSHKDFFNALKDVPDKDKPFTILVSSYKKHPFSHSADMSIVLPTWRSLNYPYLIHPSIIQSEFSFLLVDYVKVMRNQDKK